MKRATLKTTGPDRLRAEVDRTGEHDRALELKDVYKSFGLNSIIRGIDLTVLRGTRHAIIGPNGAGKSTLMHLMTGRLTPTGGAIYLGNRNVTGWPAHRISRAGLTRSFQITNIFQRMSVFENLRCAALWPSGQRYVWWRPIDALTHVNERADRILTQIGLSAKRDQIAGALTYAEQRALEIGLAIVGDPQVILLDEPTAGMSRGEAEHAVALIRDVTQAPRTLIIIEHDMSVVFSLADRISVLVYGQIVATGTPDEVRANHAVQEAYLGTEA